MLGHSKSQAHNGSLITSIRTSLSLHMLEVIAGLSSLWISKSKHLSVVSLIKYVQIPLLTCAAEV